MGITTLELVSFALVIAYLQVYVFQEGESFSSQAKQLVRLPGLQPGWILGRSVDLSDHQWRSFREGMPLLGVALAAYAGLSRTVVQMLIPGPRGRQLFCLCFALIFLGVLHGCYLIHVLVLVSANYCLSRMVAGSRWGLPLVWAANCSTFVAVRLTDGFPFASISPALAFLDSHGGMMRWHISYNLLVLRMISYAADFHWATLNRSEASTAVTQCDTSSRGIQKARVKMHQPMHIYADFTMYLAYVLYPPLYVAGPIITFNSFAAQRTSTPVNSTSQVMGYALRWLAAWLCLECITHTLYFNAIASRRLWPFLETQGLEIRPFHYAIGSLWVLIFMWLKFLVIWRFFRLAALLDGVDPPENMTRCICNNYDIEGFWRNWHASYNQWLVRYMYIPLGGACWRLLNVWLIFTFVGVWHDLEWRLLSWAWIMALFMAPELAVKSLAQAKCMAHVKGTWVYRHMCAAAASINILVLMTANMVGFVLGAEGVLPILRKISSDTGFMVVIMATLFCASHLMFAIRDGEKGQLPWLASLCPWACRGGRGELPQGTTATKDEDRKV